MDVDDLEECLLCGASISDYSKHRQWHEDRGDEWPSLPFQIGQSIVTVGIAWATAKWRASRNK
jgi:hypothetical protein